VILILSTEFDYSTSNVSEWLIYLNKNFVRLNNEEQLINFINNDINTTLWSAKKDHIDVCKYCEFRYMCLDSRLPIKRKDKEWYFETECNYNPYIAKWQHEKGYKTLEQCGITSNQTGFKLNRKKLNAINKELWGEDK
jgi:hypothetical protein